MTDSAGYQLVPNQHPTVWRARMFVRAPSGDVGAVLEVDFDQDAVRVRLENRAEAWWPIGAVREVPLGDPRNPLSEAGA